MEPNRLLASVAFCTATLFVAPATRADGDGPPAQEPLPKREEFDSAIGLLSSDAFAEAYGVYLDDLATARDRSSDLSRRIASWTSRTLRPLLEEVGRYNSEAAAYKAAGCEGRVPPEQYKRCVSWKSRLDPWHKELQTRTTAAGVTESSFSAEVKTLQPLVRRAFDNARTVLDPNNTEQVFRLYIFWAVELDKSIASRDRDSCRTFARIATALGKRVANQEIFIDLLVRNLVERRPFDISRLAGTPPLTPVTRWGDEFGRSASAFNAKGFKKTFYDNISENQVRHAAAFMRVGYGFTGPAANVASLFGDKLKGEEADYRLAVEAALMGWQLRRGKLTTATFGRAIETRLCE